MSEGQEIEPQRWEYFVTPLLLHNEAQILNNWGGQGWELVQIIAGPRSVANGEIEIKDRKTGARETMTIEAAINKLVG